MKLELNSEQQMIVETVRSFVENELIPYEDEVEEMNAVRPELAQQIIDKSLQYGLYAANMRARSVLTQYVSRYAGIVCV